MNNRISRYLIRFQSHLHVTPGIKESAVRELYTHLEDRIQELKRNDLNEEEAEELALHALGSPETIAQEIYETHAQGSWQESFLAALPHLLVALLIVASYYWQSIACLLITLIAIAVVTVYGWYQNKPTWLMPWLGYYLLPVIIGGVLLIYLSAGWGWIATLIYITLALSAIIYIARQVAQQDKLNALLMLSPMLVAFSWLLSLGTGEEFSTGSVVIEQMESRILWVIISFLSLAIATAIFVRLRQRQYKIAILLIPPIIIPLLIALEGGGNASFGSWVLQAIFLCAFISPLFIRTEQVFSLPKRQEKWGTS
ncbi:MAG: hypothetical protein J7K94_07085 [Dehalococcoidia bacterium]|nr:hypothetical protein [Dehalococcoidia bacterium]